MANGTGKKVVVGTLLGLGLGYAAGILTAPKSGKETRADLKRVSEKTIAEVEKQLKRVYADLDGVLDDARAKAKALSEKGKEEFAVLYAKAEDAKLKVRELIRAVRNGNASDPELQAAVDQALQAKNNIVTYLKKNTKQ